MNKLFKKLDPETLKDRIEGNKIILDADGHFPKPVIIFFSSGKKMEYRLFKTQFDKFKLER